MEISRVFWIIIIIKVTDQSFYVLQADKPHGMLVEHDRNS